MKRYLIILTLIVVPTVQAAVFEHYAGGLYSSGQVYAEDNTLIDGPYSDSNENVSDSWIELSAEVTDAYGYASTEDQQTYGTYYQIVPGAGEQFGSHTSTQQIPLPKNI